jgi:enolase (EC 4.2.1.11)
MFDQETAVMAAIRSLSAREILDSRGNPTLEIDLLLDDGFLARAAVPAGASTGSGEARERRDGGPRYGGRGVLQAMQGLREHIAPALIGQDPVHQARIDHRLIELDGTPDKSALGGNTLVGVSMAVARAGAAANGQPLYRHLAHLAGTRGLELPVPMFNVLNGGVHADNTVDCQEFMIAPVGAPTFAEALRMAAETYHALSARLKSRGLGSAVGDEGGFAPRLKADVEAIELIVEAIGDAGFRPGRDIVIALDPAASEFSQQGRYTFRKSGAGEKDAGQMIELYRSWLDAYPIWSLEDGLAEDDWEGWRELRRQLGSRVQLVGDDILVTDPAIIRRAQQDDIANAALIKLNQIGTVTETLQAIRTAHDGHWGTVVSHRSGETPDDFIADLAVGAVTGQIKSGAPARGERIAKYNQLLRIEQQLGSEAPYAGKRFAALGRFHHA